MKVAVVGATGMVGEIMRSVLEERNFPITEFLPVASARSIGKTICFQGKDYTVIGLEEAVERAPDFALFSAGGKLLSIGHPNLLPSGQPSLTIHLLGGCIPITSSLFPKLMQIN